MAVRSAGTLAARLFGLAATFAFAVIAARLLGPRGYGIVAVGLSTATIAASVACLGIGDLAVRETASARTNVRTFAFWATRTVGASSLVLMAVVAAAAIAPGPYRTAYLLGCLAVPLLVALSVIRGIVQGIGKVVTAQAPVELVRWILTLALVGALVLDRRPMTPAIILIAALVGLGGAVFVGITLLRRLLGPRSVRRFDRRESGWFTQALPFLAISIFSIIGTEISTLLLGLFSGPVEAGLYQPIAKLAPIMMMANTAIESALAPRTVHLWESEDRRGLQRLFARASVASTVATAILSLTIVLASPWVLQSFGPHFTRYGYLLVWIAGAQIFNAATGPAPLLLSMSRDMRSRLQAQGATFVVQAGLGLLLVPTMGAVGAVISLTAAILTWSVVHWWIALRTTHIDTSVLGLARIGR